MQCYKTQGNAIKLNAMQEDLVQCKKTQCNVRRLNAM